MPLNFDRVRELFGEFDFERLFIDELGWSRPKAIPKRAVEAAAARFEARPIAELGGVVVFEVVAESGELPDAKTRFAVHKEISKTHYENLLIFVDQQRVRSEWFWVKREDGKELPRPHTFLRGQPGDLFIGKVAPLLFELSDFEKGDPQVLEVARRLKLGLDVEKVTKKFYGEFQQQHLQFLELITGIDDERQRRWYASVLLNRLMFIWFLQRKGFLDGGDLDYLGKKLEESQARGKDRFFAETLRLLFFEGFAKPAAERSAEARKILGEIRYLNGGLFLPHAIEQKNPNIAVPDKAFDNLFQLFRAYSWNLNDTPGGDANEINPDVLGYIFEKYINQKAFGAYYTRTEITTYLCERTIHRLVLDAVNTPKDEFVRSLPGKTYDFKSVSDLLAHLDGDLARRLLREVLPKLSILDPACGSGAFLVAAMKTLINIYTAVLGYARYRDHGNLRHEVDEIEREHPNVEYYVKKLIITKNLYGVDIMEEAVEIAKLRLFLALVASARSVDQLEPLPNIDFNLLPGNSLIGLMRVDEAKFDKQLKLFGKSYRQVVDEKDRRVRSYRDAATYSEDLRTLRDGIDRLRSEAGLALDQLLLDEFNDLQIKFEHATWDQARNREGRPEKRNLNQDDIRELHPFHWGYEFDEIVNRRGGFDAILTNPPWDKFKPVSKEFFEEHSDLVSKNNMTIQEFEREQKKLLRNPEIRAAWLEYLSRFPHQSAYYRRSQDYIGQISRIGSKTQSSDLNLYKLFIERCFRLLNDHGTCGMIVQGGFHSDLGAKGLRQLLFEESEIDSLFVMSNERYVFENVHHSQKFCVLTFAKGADTVEINAAFRMNPREAVGPSSLNAFLHDPAQHVQIPVDLVRRLSPDSMSILEFRSASDIQIAEKLYRFPRLGEPRPDEWNIRLTRELDMTNDSDLFLESPGRHRLPLYEGKMIGAFDFSFAPPRYWVEERDASRALPGKEFERHRFAFREVARSTDTRTMICALLPRHVVAGHTLVLQKLDHDAGPRCGPAETLFLVGVFNSMVCDWLVRQQVSAHVSMFYVYQLPVPRLSPGDPLFDAIVARSARLNCSTEEFRDFATSAGVSVTAVPSPETRVKLMAEIDAAVAHLYGLAEGELRAIMQTFPLVEDTVKSMVLMAFGSWQVPSDDPLARAVRAGESFRLEFKSSARWDFQRKQVNKELEHVIVKTVAAFLNSEGGTLLIGVADDGSVVGLEPDYATIGGKKNADAYENWLMTRLLESLGRDRARLLRVTFHKIEGREICRVDVERSSRAVYVKDAQGQEKLYIRAGNSTRDLRVSEIADYCNDHFVRGVPAAASGSPPAPGETKPDGGNQNRLPIASTPARKTASFPTHGLFAGAPAKDRHEARIHDGETEQADPAGPSVDDDENSASGSGYDESRAEADSSPRRRLVDQCTVDEVLLFVREVVTGSDPIAREDTIREIATLLGAERVGSRVRGLIEDALRTASRRYIIQTVEQGLIPGTRSIEDYDRDFLKTALRNVVGRTWTDEEDAIRGATRWLGFRRTGSRIEQAFRSAIRGALRQDLMERDRERIRFVN